MVEGTGMVKFVSLGSGSSGNCYYLSYGNTQILIDAGISVRALKRHLKDKGIRLDSIDAVFITHDHADHIKAVGTLATDYNLGIYATELVHLGIQHNYSVTTKVPASHVHIIQKRQSVCIGGLSVTAFEVPHDSSDCVGYRIETPELVFVIVTDVGHATTEIMSQISEADYIVLEANHDEDMLMMGPYPAHLKGRIRSDRGHLSNRDGARLIAEHASPRLKKVWLCHLSEENNHPELARKTYDMVLRDYGLIANVDFRIDVLRRKQPGEIEELT